MKIRFCVGFIRVDVLDLIGLSRIDLWTFFIKQNMKRFSVGFRMSRNGSEKASGINNVLTILFDDLLPSLIQLHNSAFVENLVLRGKKLNQLTFDSLVWIEQTNSGTGILLMIFHDKHHTAFFELTLRFYLFRSNKVKCDENDRLKSPLQINAKQWINNKTWNFLLLNNLWNVSCQIPYTAWSLQWRRTTSNDYSHLAEKSEMTLLTTQYYSIKWGRISVRKYSFSYMLLIWR